MPITSVSKTSSIALTTWRILVQSTARASACARWPPLAKFSIPHKLFIDARGHMLSFHAPGEAGIEAAMDAKAVPSGVNWIDALRPDRQEIAFLERTLKIEVPTLETLSEIETSSRLRSEKDWLYLSIPMIHWADGFMPALTPLGFVLSKDILLTVRFEQMKGLDDVLETISR